MNMLTCYSKRLNDVVLFILLLNVIILNPDHKINSLNFKWNGNDHCSSWDKSFHGQYFILLHYI
jgi:hypothetical protein